MDIFLQDVVSDLKKKKNSGTQEIFAFLIRVLLNK